MPAVRPRLVWWVGREMWVTQRDSDSWLLHNWRWVACGRQWAWEMCVGGESPRLLCVPYPLNGRLGARGFTGHGSSQAEVANGHYRAGRPELPAGTAGVCSHTRLHASLQTQTQGRTNPLLCTLPKYPPTHTHSLTHSLTLPTHTHTHTLLFSLSQRGIFLLSLSAFECVGALLSFRCFTFTQVVNWRITNLWNLLLKYLVLLF